SRTERATLVGTSDLGTIADSVGIGAVQAAVGLCEVDVALRRQAAFLQVGRAFTQEAMLFFAGKRILARFACPGRHIAEQLIDEPLQLALDLAVREARAHEADSAVDVVADAARTDDAAFCWIGRADAADAEAVAPVNVGHR